MSPAIMARSASVSAASACIRGVAREVGGVGGGVGKALALKGTKGTKVSPVSVMVRTTAPAELGGSALSPRFCSSVLERSAAPADGSTVTELLETKQWCQATAAAGMRSISASAERMSYAAICGTVIRSSVGSSTAIDFDVITPTLASSHPPGCGATACSPRTTRRPRCRASRGRHATRQRRAGRRSCTR